jgi:hypothetical protein
MFHRTRLVPILIGVVVLGIAIVILPPRPGPHVAVADSGVPSCTPPPPVRLVEAVIGDFGICEWKNGSGGGSTTDPHWRCARQREIRDFVISPMGASKLLTVGDNTYEWARNVGFQVDNQDFYATFYPSNFFPTLGNHDWDDHPPTPTPQAGDGIYLNADNYQYLDDYTVSLAGQSKNNSGGRYYQFQDGVNLVKGNPASRPLVQFFALDADPNEPDDRAPGSVQETWMRQEMDGSPACFKVAYFHQPAYTSGATHLPEEAMQWDYRARGIDAVFMGHAHQFEFLFINNVFYFVNGLGGAVNLHAFGTPVSGSIARYPPNTSAPYDNDRGAQQVMFSIDSKGVGRFSESMFVIDTANSAADEASTPVPNRRLIHAVGKSKQCGLRWIPPAACYATSQPEPTPVVDQYFTFSSEQEVEDFHNQN